jgi:outer membrane protein TolC
MADEQRPEEVQRWTAKRRAALVISLLKGETTVVEAAQQHGLKVAEVKGWRDCVLLAAENGLRAQPKEDAALHEEMVNWLKAIVASAKTLARAVPRMFVIIAIYMFRDYLIVLAVAAALCMIALAPIRACCSNHSLTLPEAIDRALKIAPAVAFASAQSDLSGAQANAARAPLVPGVFGHAEYNDSPGYDPTISNSGLSLGQLALDYTAFDGGRRAAQLRAARYAAQAAALGLRAARAQIVFDTTVAYFDLMRARNTEKELATSLKRLQQYVEIVRSLRRSGRAIANDVLKIETTCDSAELAAGQARDARQRASVMLGSLIGEYDATEISVAETSTLPPLPRGGVEASPVLMAAEHQMRAAQLNIEAAQAERYPTLKLQLTAGYEGVYPRQTIRRFYGASYDGAISVPIFQGGLVSAHIDAAKAAAHAAAAQERQTKLQLVRTLADARIGYDNARTQLGVLAHSQSTANSAFSLYWTRFLGGGNATILEVLDAYQQAENFKLAGFAQEFAVRQAAAEAALIFDVVEQ